jgi:hypothetical protein
MHAAWRTGLHSWLVLAAVCLPAVPARAAPGAGQEVLTNQSVVELTRAHLGTAVIVQQVRSLPGRYALSTRDLVKLKQAGVADEVILAMQQKAAEGTQAPRSEPARTGRRPDWPQGQWKVVPTTDPSGKAGVAGTMWQPIEIGSRTGQVEVTYFCGTIELRVAFDGEQNLGLRWNQPQVVGSTDVYWKNEYVDQNGWSRGADGSKFRYAGGTTPPGWS